ncbi:MAG TPA: hypothetical protein PL041_06740 [Melioribacteraceae bacterium]|nr:hypothetical protein [Melioribacteraceae bacterium]
MASYQNLDLQYSKFTSILSREIIKTVAKKLCPISLRIREILLCRKDDADKSSI